MSSSPLLFLSETKFVLSEILFICWLAKDFQKLKIYKSNKIHLITKEYMNFSSKINTKC